MTAISLCVNDIIEAVAKEDDFYNEFGEEEKKKLEDRILRVASDWADMVKRHCKDDFFQYTPEFCVIGRPVEIKAIRIAFIEQWPVFVVAWEKDYKEYNAQGTYVSSTLPHEHDPADTYNVTQMLESPQLAQPICWQIIFNTLASNVPSIPLTGSLFCIAREISGYVDELAKYDSFTEQYKERICAMVYTRFFQVAEFILQAVSQSKGAATADARFKTCIRARKVDIDILRFVFSKFHNINLSVHEKKEHLHSSHPFDLVAFVGQFDRGKTSKCYSVTLLGAARGQSPRGLISSEPARQSAASPLLIQTRPFARSDMD